MTTPVQILRKYAIKPEKRLGQSFLIDCNIIEKIVASVDATKDDRVVEIGAGIGVMTSMIARRAGHVTALDIDAKMIDILRNELKGTPNVTILQQDVLAYDFSSAYDEKPFIVAGNIPYNISSQILFRLISFRHCISSMVLMFQKEVAERIIAPPATREYGILSVMTGLYMDVKKIAVVPPKCFSPQPKVDSVVLRMVMRRTPLYHLRDSAMLLQVVKASLGKRRKTLVNSIKTSPLAEHLASGIEEILKRAGIDGRRRGETLTIAEFVRLAEVIEEREKKRSLE